MTDWLDLVDRIDALDGLGFNAALVADMERRFGHLHGPHVGPVHFYTPTFKSYSTSEIAACGKSAWPAVSITGGDCKLQCDHCKARILEPMIEARTPEALWRVVNEQIGVGAQGMLLTGGSNRRNEVEYDAFYPTIRRIKDAYPGFRLAVHTALVDHATARRMEESGIDVAMIDVIGAQDTITQVYHLRRGVSDFERALEALVASTLKVVPHIVIGLHYGRMLGEWRALEMLTRHKPDAVVLVVVMPFYFPENRPFAIPGSEEVGAFFMDAREALPDIPLLLGCARPAGIPKTRIDAYAVMAGLNGVAHPSDGMVELAARLGRGVRVTASCCSVAVGDEVLAAESGDPTLQIDVDRIIAQERQRKHAAGGLASIQIVASGPSDG
jgi:lipoyl synthase